MPRLRQSAAAAIAVLGGMLCPRAQCHESATGGVIGTGDDIVLPMQALGFPFPFGGTTYTHIHPTTNGFAYLSNSGAPAPGGALYPGTTAQLVLGSPKVCPFWGDLDIVPGTGTVKFNALPGKAVVAWEDAIEFGAAAPAPQFTFQLQLFASGDIHFTYDARCVIVTPGDFLVGMSQGGGALVPAAADFSFAGGSGTTTNHERFDNAGLGFDLAGDVLQFVAAGAGYAWVPANCVAVHSAYGAGCYAASNSIYQWTGPPAVSSAALSNTAITMVPTGTGYAVFPGGTFLPPTAAATPLALIDDGQVTSPALAMPFPHPGGTVNAFTVCSNGFVSAASGNGVGFAPVVATMLGNPQAAWYSWHDYNPAAPGSGQVKFEQVNPALATLTWDGVYNYGGTSAADASTFQFQFHSPTGAVTIAWRTMSANPQTLGAGEPHLAGYSPAGPSLDTGSVTFATGLPAAIGMAEMVPLALTASPPPLSTPAGGSTTTFTTGNIPEFAPASGLFVALQVMSLGQVPAPGLDLGFLGAPGCAALIAGLDYTRSMVGATATQTVTLAWPAGLPLGTTVYSQSIALVLPNSLPNGQNPFGMTTSNAIRSVTGQW